jgi:hypothetical protein
LVLVAVLTTGVATTNTTQQKTKSFACVVDLLQ